MNGFDLRKHVDPSLSLSELSAKIHSLFDRDEHFALRYDYCLPVLRSDDTESVLRLVAAYICHEPYRSITDNVHVQPFREAVLTASQRTNDCVAKVLHDLVLGSSQKVADLALLPVSTLSRKVQASQTAKSVVTSQDLLNKATLQILSMSEHRSLLSQLESTQIVDSLKPSQLALIAVNHPMLTAELVVYISRELLRQTNAKDLIAILLSYCEALRQLPPGPRSFDIITRLLRSDEPAPAPIFNNALFIPFRTTIAHITRHFILGAFIAHSISFLEQSEAQQETSIIAELNESGLTTYDRREVETRLEGAMARQVGSFCHFVTSLIKSALLFPPDLGSLRRQISAQSSLEPSQIELLRTEVMEMEMDLQSMTEATLIELKHFALRFGRYKDGSRLFSQLSSLV